VCPLHSDLEKRLGTYVKYRKYEKYMKKNQFCDTICDQVIGGEGRILFIIDDPQLGCAYKHLKIIND
jgi:hypothetical protein